MQCDEDDLSSQQFKSKKGKVQKKEKITFVALWEWKIRQYETFGKNLMVLVFFIAQHFKIDF